MIIRRFLQPVTVYDRGSVPRVHADHKNHTNVLCQSATTETHPVSHDPPQTGASEH
jgi:hypothetical protein